VVLLHVISRFGQHVGLSFPGLLRKIILWRTRTFYSIVGTL
jgi:hypothetical protein